MTPTYPLWDASVLALPPLYYYIRDPLLACRRQVESLVILSVLAIHPPSLPLLPVAETVFQAAVVRPESQRTHIPTLLYSTTRNGHYSLRIHCIGGDIQGK
jgi:hypothetical protein